MTSITPLGDIQIHENDYIMFKRHKVWAVSGFFPAPKSYVQLVITLQLQRNMGCYLSTGHGPDSVLMDLLI